MQVLKVFIWIFVGLGALYLLLSFVFMHLSLEYRKKIKNSDEVITSHLKSHISLLDLLIDETNKHFTFTKRVDSTLLGEDNAKCIERLDEIESSLLEVIEKEKIVLPLETNYVLALEQNTKLLRDEVFRYNSYVENFNIICGSFIFRPIVKILRLTKKAKY